MKEYNEDEFEVALDDMVKAGYLKKTTKGYIDSDEVVVMLKEGKTRKQISRIFERRNK